MSHLLDQLRFFNRKQNEFSDGHGETRKESRDWENVYRSRWQYDKIVRSTHGVNCTGSCSWKIYVKNGLITWETQQTDYPRTRNDLPNHDVAARAVRATAGTSTAPTGSSTRRSASRCSNCGVKHARPSHRWKPGRALSRTRSRPTPTRASAAWAVSFARTGRR
ncbi:hypothetical protein PsexTeo8_23580 [Pseudomonas extremaustralis]|nr:hypothetical protein [Pseudomonas extremaustralis]